jgi:hypothetical protein
MRAAQNENSGIIYSLFSMPYNTELLEILGKKWVRSADPGSIGAKTNALGPLAIRSLLLVTPNQKWAPCQAAVML